MNSASRRSGLSDSAKGIDGFKKIKGIKRHIVVDSQGNILYVHTTCANVNDAKARLEIIPCVKQKYPSLLSHGSTTVGGLHGIMNGPAKGRPK